MFHTSSWNPLAFLHSATNLCTPTNFTLPHVTFVSHCVAPLLSPEAQNTQVESRNIAMMSPPHILSMNVTSSQSKQEQQRHEPVDGHSRSPRPLVLDIASVA